ncbi:sensor histidine kinase [Faecalicatena contorta]|uniref:sensor histidine kinase n=1 Tax=Faecalicatena contorta TaxID=39482 RepID=UPI00189C2AC6|nr:histidine kinase [Faecalicatena contorta]
MLSKAKELYLRLIKGKLVNQIIFVIGIICFIQIIIVCLMYLYMYHSREEEIISNNMQILHQANTNYFSGIVDDLSVASKEMFYDKIFWESGGEESVSEDNQIYNILASKYNSASDIDSIYLYSSASNKFYIMDEVSFNHIPIKSTENTLYILNGHDLEEMPWYTAAETSNALAVTVSKEIRYDEKDIICFSRYIQYPLKNDDYYFVISVNINKSRLDTLYRQFNSEEEELLIFDNDLQLIYDSEEREEKALNSLKDAVSIHDESGYWFRQKIDNKKCIVIADKSQNEGWTMVKIVPEDQIMKGIKTQFISNCILVLMIFGLGILVLYYIINRTMKPIENLAGTMRHYKQGESYEEPLLAKRSDEVGTLYSSFEKMNLRINTLIESEYQSQIQEKQAKLEALQAQLDPHFLYNTLQTISGIAIENNVLEIEEINNALSGILRYSLNNSKSIVKVSEEVRIVRDYMDIQKYRFGDKISLEIKLSEKALDMLVPVFTLQLPVENAIKHGMEKTTKAVHICIYDIIREDVYPRTYRNTSPAGGVSAKLKNKVYPRAPRISYPCGANFRLKLKNKVSPRAPRISGPCGADFQLKLKNKVCEFYIEDNGDGVEAERLKEIQNMLNSKGGAPANGYKQKGLVNLNERIRQQFGPAYGVSIEQRDGGGIRVKITVPGGKADAESSNCR